jgi:asparagine synthase (glutamine-hydrolysing)
MCGIAGIRLRNDPVSESQLRALAETLRHRGPDDIGIYMDGPLGLVQSRLSIIDIEHGHQPLFSDDGSLCLIANGEIYNHIELRAELESRGHGFATHSDCEPLIQAYREYGMDFLSHVHGMYAIALYDRPRDRLILARDRLGIKPLFMGRTENGFYFSSEMKTLFRAMPRCPTINAAGLAQILQTNFSTGSTTLVQGVERVLPGEMICIEGGSIKSRSRYWDIRHVKPRHYTFDEAEHQFGTLLAQVIPQHLRSDVPYGLFLSGGVDSSLLAALITEHTSSPLRTFSVGFSSAGAHSELASAATVASGLGAQHTALTLSLDDLLLQLVHSVWAADELMCDYANLPTSLLAKRAGRELKVIFSGEGGDEVFAGYGRYRPNLFKQTLNWLRSPRTGGFRGKGTMDHSWEKVLLNKCLYDAMQHWRAPYIEAWQNSPEPWSRLQKMQYVDLTTWLPDDLLVKADRMLMARGVEGRVPFLDHRVVEFGISLPDVLKINGRSGKIFLKRYGERYFSRQHLWGRKRGFTVPIRAWLSGAFLARLEQALLTHRGIREWLNPAGIRQLVELQRSYGSASQILWTLLQFAIWHQIFIEGDGEKPPEALDPITFITQA